MSRLLTAFLVPWGALLGWRQAMAVVGVLIPTPLKMLCFGLDLARALGVVVWGLGESLAGPRSLPTTLTRSRAMYLLGGVVARPPLLWTLELYQAASLTVIPLGRCGGGLLAWTCERKWLPPYVVLVINDNP